MRSISISEMLFHPISHVGCQGRDNLPSFFLDF